MRQFLFSLVVVATVAFSTAALAEQVLNTSPQEYSFADLKNHYKFMFKGFEEQTDGTFQIYFQTEWKLSEGEYSTNTLRFKLPENLQFYKEGSYLYVNWNGYNCKVAKKGWGYPGWHTKKDLDAEIDILHKIEFSLNTKHTLIVGADLILKDTCLTE